MLPPYAVPVDPAVLQVDGIYFSVTFLASGMLCPVLLPLRYLGIEHEEGNVRHVFEDIHGSQMGRDAGIGGQNFSYGLSELSSVFEYANAVDVLLGCLIRREEAQED